MTNLPLALENAFAAYLTESATAAAGGVWIFKAANGSGTAIAVRTGHSNDGELPASGVIIVQSVNASVEQMIVGVNAWGAVLTVELRYPVGDHSSDSDSLASFDYLAQEISGALSNPDMIDRVNRYGGVFVHGLREGMAMESLLEDTRGYRWVLSLALSSTKTPTIDL